MKRLLKKYIFVFLLSFFIGLFAVNSSYAETTVTTEDQLQTAINNNEDIVINTNISITKSITIPNTYNKTIKLTGNSTLNMNFVGDMFVVQGANFTLDGGVINGNENGRAFNIFGNSNVTVKGTTIKNASTEKFPKKIENGSNTQKYSGGAVTISHSVLNLENVIFQEKHSKAVTPNPEKAGDPGI